MRFRRAGYTVVCKSGERGVIVALGTWGYILDSEICMEGIESFKNER